MHVLCIYVSVSTLEGDNGSVQHGISQRNNQGFEMFDILSMAAELSDIS